MSVSRRRFMERCIAAGETTLFGAYLSTEPPKRPREGNWQPAYEKLEEAGLFEERIKQADSLSHYP